MKKVLLSAFMILFCLSGKLNAQELKFEVVKAEKLQYQYLISVEEDNIKALFGIEKTPVVGATKVYPVIVNFNENFTESYYTDLPANTPYTFKISSFNGNNFIYGTDYKPYLATNILKYDEPNKVMAFSTDGEVLFSKTYNIGKKFRFFQPPKIKLNSDSTNIIITNLWAIMTNNSFKNDTIQLDVYDRNWNVAWEGVTNKYNISGLYDYDYYNNELICICAVKYKKLYRFKVISISNEQTNILLEKDFIHRDFSFKQYIHNGILYIVGINYLAYQTTFSYKKNDPSLFYCKIDLNNYEKSQVLKKYDKNVLKDQYLKDLNNLANMQIAKIIKTSDGITGIIKPQIDENKLEIIIIKFDFEGNIVWVKNINRDYALFRDTDDNPIVYSAFSWNDDIYIFHNDNLNNFNSDNKTKSAVTVNNKCLAMTKITKAGEMTTKNIFNIKENKIEIDVLNIRQLKNKFYFFKKNSLEMYSTLEVD